MAQPQPVVFSHVLFSV